MIDLLSVNNGRMPTTQQQYDTMVMKLRQMKHMLERSPGNIHQTIQQHHNRQGYFMEGEETNDIMYVDPNQSSQTSSGSSHPWCHAPEENTGTYFGGPTPPPGIPDDYDSGTDTDTISSVGDTTYTEAPDARLPNEQLQEIFWAYQAAKGRWRRATNKPTRKVRRFFRKRFAHKGKGKGNRGRVRLTGNAITHFAKSLPDDEYEELFFGEGKGKGKRKKKR